MVEKVQHRALKLLKWFRYVIHLGGIKTEYAISVWATNVYV